MPYHLSSQTKKRIAEEIGGDFVLISSSQFLSDAGKNRTRYSVRKPNGKKQLHLIGYEDGTIKLIS